MIDARTMVDGAPEYFKVFWTGTDGNRHMLEAASPKAVKDIREVLEGRQRGERETIEFNAGMIAVFYTQPPPKPGTSIKVARFRGEWT
jgi:hypothetical protein